MQNDQPQKRDMRQLGSLPTLLGPSELDASVGTETRSQDMNIEQILSLIHI